MSDDKKSMIGDVADTVKGIVEAVPVYRDAVQPAAQEFGKTIEPAGQELGKAIVTVSKVVTIALSPLSAIVWGWEKVSAWVNEDISEKLKNVPQEDLVTPSLHVLGPAAEALRFAGHDVDLRELYSNLIAASMDSKTATLAHPAFVEVIRQLSPDEAKILAYFNTLPVRQRMCPIVNAIFQRKEGKVTLATSLALRYITSIHKDAACVHQELMPSYLDNLQRLGLIEVSFSKWFNDESRYDQIKQVTALKHWLDNAGTDENQPALRNGVIVVTDFGNLFLAACIADHDEIRSKQDKM